MTARLVVLEDFGSVAAANAMSGPEEVAQTDRLAAFEEGYKAGWDDAAKAQGESEARMAADLAGNLADLSFTFHEARSHVLSAIEPLLKQIVAKVLPEAAREAMPQMIADIAMRTFNDAASAPIVIVAAPESRDRIEALLPADPGFPLEVRAEPTLTGGQAFIRTGGVEQCIDVDATLAAIDDAIADFFTLTHDEKVQAHG